MEDLTSLTRYVSWSLMSKSRTGLKGMLEKITLAHSQDLDLVSMLESQIFDRTLGGSQEDIVAALVCQIFEGIRDHFVQSVELKFNCFFLMPLVDTFPARIREELECAYDEDLDEVFDVGAVRLALEGRLKNLESELQCVERLQQKFAMIHSTLSVVVSGNGNKAGGLGLGKKKGVMLRESVGGVDGVEVGVGVGVGGV